MATFGRTDVGAATFSYNSLKAVHSYTAVAGAVTKLSAYLVGGATGTSQNVRGVIYADNAGSPGALLGVTNEVSILANASPTWVDLVFPTPVSVSAATVWIGLWFGGGSTVAYVYADSAGGDKFNANAYSSTGSPADPFGTASSTTSGSRYSLYATVASAPTFVAEAHGDSGGVSAASFSVTKPTAPNALAQGDCLLLAIEASSVSATTLTPPVGSGWSLLEGQLAGSAFGSMWVYYKVVGASEPSSWTFTSSVAKFFAYSIVAYRGANATDPVEGHASANAAAGASATTPSLTTSGDNRTVVSFFGKDGFAGTLSWTSAGANERTDYMESGSQVSIAAFDETKATAGAISRTATEGSGNATNNSRETQTAIVSLASVPTPVSGGSGTFGRDTVGAATETGATGFKEVDQRTAVTGQVTKLVAYLSGAGGASQKVRGILYADNAGSPGALIGVTQETTVGATQAPGWVDLAFTTPPNVNGGAIWVGLWWGASDSMALVACDPVGGASYQTGDTYSSTGNPSSTFTVTGTTSGHANLSVYAVVGAASNPTFGNATIGGSFAPMNGSAKEVSGPFRPPSDGQVSQVFAYLRGQGATQTFRAVIYQNAAGVPGAFVAVSNEVTIAANQGAGWVTFTLPAAVAVSSASTYWLGLWQGAPSVAGQNAQVAFDSALTMAFNGNAYSSSASPSDPFGTVSTAVMNLSIYAALSATAGVPSNTVAPVVSGTPAVGSTLSVSNGTWTGSPTSYSYQWKRDGVPIIGASSSSYTVVSADVGHTLIASVTATNGSGSASVDSAPTAAVTSGNPVNTVAPVVSGTPNAGQTLTCSTGTWSGATSYTYQWQRSSSPTGATGWSDITGATSNSYSVQTGDASFFSGAPAYFSCVVTGYA